MQVKPFGSLIFPFFFSTWNLHSTLSQTLPSSCIYHVILNFYLSAKLVTVSNQVFFKCSVHKSLSKCLMNMPLFFFLFPLICNSGQQTFSVKSHIVNISDFVDHMVSALIIQLCHWSTKAGIDSTETKAFFQEFFCYRLKI